jgi:adenylosuccinate lyase
MTAKTPVPPASAAAPDALLALSPLDGRYAQAAAPLRPHFSEAALIRHRVAVEARWFAHLAHHIDVPALRALPPRVSAAAAALAASARADEGAAVKALERTTNHDVKAVEYYVREALKGAGASEAALEFVHFGCTSEDINNLCYALMLREARDAVLEPALERINRWLLDGAREYAELAMLSRTHGQSASPTTLGKEFANVAARLERARRNFVAVEILGKLNGAVGNWNAHALACPELDWRAISRSFVTGLGIGYNEYTTQIEPHDWIAAYCDALARIAIILIDFCRDVWGYVSLGYFRQRTVAGEVGSSTMPHKVNPIDFENGEGNLGLAVALLRHFAEKLPVSRWQRDLTDSTVLRNLGVALGHTLISLVAIERGLGRLEPDRQRMATELDASWEVLGEAVQTVMRRYGVPEAYERLKELTRGKRIGPEALREFVAHLDIPPDARARLATLTPASYVGLAPVLARELAQRRVAPGEIAVVDADWVADRATLVRLRRTVFITELGIAEVDEWDTEDARSVHLLALVNREPVGTARLTPTGKIGRLAVLAPYRRCGIGTQLLRRLLAVARTRGLTEVYLHAQTEAVPFYLAHAFVAEGEPFREAGIEHRRLRLALGSAHAESSGGGRSRS